MPQLQYYPVRETLFSAEAGTRYVSFGLRCCAPEQGAPQLAFIPVQIPAHLTTYSAKS